MRINLLRQIFDLSGFYIYTIPRVLHVLHNTNNLLRAHFAALE